MTNKTDVPRFRDGYPENLAAAALDALWWLEHLERQVPLRRDNRAKLKGCIDALRGHIPEGEPIFEAVRVLEDSEGESANDNQS